MGKHAMKNYILIGIMTLLYTPAENLHAGGH